MLSRACEYAIRAMIYINYKSKKNTKTSLNEIAEAIDSPVAFTAKILQQLRKNNLLESTIGARGGFSMPENKQINLKEIIVIIDGDGIFKKCVLGLKSCSITNPCPLHEKYSKIKMDIEATMQEYLLEDFIEELESKKITLK